MLHNFSSGDIYVSDQLTPQLSTFREGLKVHIAMR